MITPYFQPSCRPSAFRVPRVETPADTPATVARPAWQCLAAPLIPLAAVLLDGGTTRWSQSLLLLAVGVLLAAAPPRFSVGRTLNVVLGSLLLLAGTAFLPARWFLTPLWRAALTDDFATALPGTLSPQPFVSAECAVLFVAGAAWFYLMTTWQWRPADRLRAGRVFAGGVVALAALFLALHHLDLVPPIWHNERHFGSFPNRNQTADFLALGSIVILACAQLAWLADRQREAVGWALGWIVVALALFDSFSRAGVVLLFGQVAVYLLVEIFRTPRRPARFREPVAKGSDKGGAAWSSVLNPKVRWTAMSLALLLLLASLFLLFGGGTLERFQPSSASATVDAVTGEFRLKIQADALRMISASPWCGLGLGCFSEVFALFRRQSALPVRAIHPESDYLWTAAELGWPALLLIVAGLARLAARVGRSVATGGNGHDRRLRLAAGLALAAFALHGFVDVSAHRLGTVLSALFLLGIAWRDQPVPDLIGRIRHDSLTEWPLRPLPRAATAVFRGTGLLLAGVGVLWLGAATGWFLLPGQQGVNTLRTRAARLATAGNYPDVEAAMGRALVWEPLNWNLSFMRAGARIYLGGDREAAAQDFRRARFLEPFLGDLPMAEAKLWASAGEQTLALSALGEACRREPAHAETYVMDAIAMAKGDPRFLDELARYTRRDPTLMVFFLEHCEGPRTRDYLAEAVAEDPGLQRLEAARKTIFLRAWAQRGSQTALLEAMPQHPEWHACGWRWWAVAAAGTGHAEQACAVAEQWAPKPILPPLTLTDATVEEIRRRAAGQSGNPALALQAYRLVSAAGDWAGAAAILQPVSKQPDCPAYIYYLEADAAGKLGDWPHAWEYWNQYFNAAKIDS